MSDQTIAEQNFCGEENLGCGIEAIQEKTGFYLAKLFEYFGEEEQKNIL